MSEISRRERVLKLMDEIRPVNKYEAAEKVEKFVLEELSRGVGEYPLKLQDLMTMHSMAAKTMTDMNFKSLNNKGYSSTKDARAWCYVDAVIRWLRSKELIDFTLKYNNKK